MKKIHSCSLILLLVIICTVESFSPSVPCRGVKCEQTFCPNPIFGICCNVCLEDCRVIFCARPNCLNPVTPRGRCCPVCPNDCSSVLCALPTCPNPIPAGPGQCCPKCTQNCAVVSCLIPDCPNAIVPPGLCCPVCPSPPLPIDCSAVRCLAPTCPNPIPPPPGECCSKCLEDCRLVRCASPNCANPITPPGRCCPVCPNPNDICELQSDPGPCEAAITRWFFDASRKQCRTFTFGGCRGNGNNFNNLSACLSTCQLRCPPGVPQAACAVDPCSVTQCPAVPNALCVSDFCGGCNARFFESDGTEVTNRCSVPTNICELPSVTGPCRLNIPSWFYNSKTKQCERFTYGGCGGNENRFEDLRSCLSRCASKCPPGTPIVQCFADPCSVTQCSSFPNAICISNFCGGCNARFFLNDGTEVTNKCSKNSCPDGQIVTSCGRTCNPTCENQRTCNKLSCSPGCSCPKGTVFDRKVAKCVDSDDCGDCPPGKPLVFCFINPCTVTNCPNVPKAECLFDNCGGCFARFFVGNKEVTDQCKLTSTCPIKGQTFQQCGGCQVTCANPNMRCTLQCRPGCSCPAGQIIDEKNNRCVTKNQCPTTSCPIDGQVFQRCRTCPATCNIPDLGCIQVCLPGCGCPPGQLIDEENNRCVPDNQCPRHHCKVDGQVYQRCRTCPATCKSFHSPCSRECTPGCGCPPGQIIDEKQNKCVPLNQCSPDKCPIRGQTFHQCKPCLITCKDVGRPIACPLICTPGCGCPTGTVLDDKRNRCIREVQCPQNVRCSATICPQIRCANTIPADPKNGRCCPTCKPVSSQCPIRGQVFQRCKSCPATCSDPKKMCTAVCQAGCGCPNGQVIDEKKQQCVQARQCTSPKSNNRCSLPVKRGSCRGRSLKYYYNSKRGRCHGFIYGGCGGNQNNFPSRYHCERICRKHALG